MTTLFPILLVSATLLVTLVAGFLFGFVIVVMPGIKQMQDGAFINAFQLMDGIIQDNHPLFVLVWVGSVILLIAAALIGFNQLEGLQRNLLLAATVLYIIGVQAPTIIINIPRNNAIQMVDVNGANATVLQQARLDFEDSWNRSNQFRTLIAIIVSILLLLILLNL